MSFLKPWLMLGFFCARVVAWDEPRIGDGVSGSQCDDAAYGGGG